MKLFPFIRLKRLAEEVAMYPFVLAGRIMARFMPLREEYDIFMFFPIYGIGGAEKVNAAVLAAMSDRKVVVFFTRKSPNDKLLHLFKLPHVRLIDISRYTDNKWIYPANFIWRGICAAYIDRQLSKPVVFNGQCNFAYKLFPHLRKDVYKVELIHNSERKFNRITFPYVPFIDQRITITDNIREDIEGYYRKLGIPDHYANRMTTIYNSVFVPEALPERRPGPKMKVYYAGRGGAQKRLHLVFRIVEESLRRCLPFEFHFAGSFKEEIPAGLMDKIVWHGQIGTTEEMYDLHRQMDVLLMTSAYEGLPLVIMEAMSCGVAVVSTAVNSIPDHIHDSVNGFLLRAEAEDEIVSEGIAKLMLLAGDPALRGSIAQRNHQYIREHFHPDRFRQAYRSILLR